MHQTMFKRNSPTKRAIKMVGHIIYMCAFVAILSTVLISCDNRIKYIDSYVIEKNGKYGLIDSLGNEILPPAYLQVRKISNSGLAIVVLDTIICHNTEKQNTWSLLLQPHDTLKVKYSYVNHEGKFQFPEPFIGCELIGDGLNADDLLNEFCINHTFKCGLALITDSISLLNGYINISGDTVIPISYVKASYFSEDIAPVLTKVETDSAIHSVVENTGKYGFIDKAGNKVSDFKFSYLTTCHHNRAIASIIYNREIEEGETIDGEITKEGKLVKKQIERKGGDTETGWATYLVDGKGQIIEQLSVANRYNNFTEDSLAVIEPNGLGAFFGMGYNFLDYDGSIYKTDGKLSDDEKIYIMDNNHMCKGHMSDDFVKMAVTYFSEGYAGVMVGNKEWVFVDKNMMVWQPEDEPYQNILPFSFGLAAVKYKGKWGYVDTDFNYIIPLKYDSCGIAGRNLCKVYNSIREPFITSYINRKGEVVWQNTEYTSSFSQKNKDSNAYYGKWRNIDYKYEPKLGSTAWYVVLCVITFLLLIGFWCYKSLRNKAQKSIPSINAQQVEEKAETPRTEEIIEESVINDPENENPRMEDKHLDSNNYRETSDKVSTGFYNQIHENNHEDTNNTQQNLGEEEPHASRKTEKEKHETEPNGSMSTFVKVIVTIGVVFLFFIVFGAIVGIRGGSGHSTPGFLGLIVFAALVGALRAIWKGKGKKKEDNSSILQE